MYEEKALEHLTNGGRVQENGSSEKDIHSLSSVKARFTHESKRIPLNWCNVSHPPLSLKSHIARFNPFASRNTMKFTTHENEWW